MSSPINLLVHPYTAEKNLGFGHDRYAYELKTRLPKFGFTPRVLQFGNPKGIASAFLAEARAVHSLVFDSTKVLYHATASMNAQCAVTSRKHPLLTTIHDVLWFFVNSKYDTQLKCALKSFGIKRAARNSDGVIVPHFCIRDFLVDELGVESSRVHVINHGVDLVQFSPIREGETIPRPGFLPPGDQNVLFVGSLTWGKGADTLIRCFEKVVSRVPNAKLVLGSSGWNKDAIHRLAESSPVRNHIRFTGFIPDDELRAAYIHSAVSVFPSRYGFGLSTLESMACGTPTVSGRTLDNPEFVGEAGLLADPDDTEELAHQITRLLEDRALHTLMKNRGLQKAAAHDWDNTVKATAQVYRGMMGLKTESVVNSLGLNQPIYAPIHF